MTLFGITFRWPPAKGARKHLLYRRPLAAFPTLSFTRVHIWDDAVTSSNSLRRTDASLDSRPPSFVSRWGVMDAATDTDVKTFNIPVEVT